MKRTKYVVPFLLSILGLALLPQAGAAYVGPGVGLPVIGAALAAIGSIFLAIAGFVWYPIKRLVRAIRARREREVVGAEDTH